MSLKQPSLKDGRAACTGVSQQMTVTFLPLDYMANMAT